MSDEIVGSTTPAEAIPSAPAVPAAPATPQAVTPAPTTGAPEDRSNWVPPHRLREARESTARQYQQQLAQREAELRAEAETYKRQLHSLVGVTPPQNPEVEQVRSQFASLYPGLAKMEEQAARLEQLLERSGDLESQNDHYWRSYGRQTVDKLFSKATESIGAPLSDEGKHLLHSAFVGWVQSTPERQDRYTNDPSIVEDFLKGFGSNFFDPIRRTATAGIPGRANVALPQDTPSGAPRVPGAPKPVDLDERVAMGWNAYKLNHPTQG